MTKPAAQPYPEERRLATVLFADVPGFTTLSDQMDFEDISDLIREVWALVDSAIEAHGGYIDKHIGDAVMAVWGAPHAGEDDAERAVSAALTLQASLAHYTTESSREGAHELKMRVGINTGQVLAGYVGARGEYTVLGDTVNIASRLETTAEPGTVVIGESTYRLVRGAFQMRRLAPLLVKGKPQPIQAYLVEGVLEQPGPVRYRSMGGLETHMVGRNSEMTRLRELYQQAVLGNSPVLAVIRGEEGLGKSRMLMEFTSQLSVNEPHVNLLSARSLAQASRAPYFVWKSLWHNRFGLSQNDPPEVACEKFVRGVQMLWGRQLGQVSAVEAAHFVGALIGLEWPDSPFLAQTPGPARANRAYEFTRELLKRACAAGPTILLLDDLHWADSGSLGLLEHVLEPADDSLPLFILGAVRPGILRQYRNLTNAAVVITLKPLSANPNLVAEAYPAIQNLPEPTLSEIARVSEGNPYFMEEMVKTLMQSFSADNGQAADDERAVQLPDSLHAMLQARLDSLSADARGVALLASVVGRVFWTGAILAAAHQSTGTGLLRPHLEALENVVSTGLAELVRAELAFPRAGSMFAGEQEYIFKHSLLRDVAYSLLPLKYRRQYHLAIARWLAKYASQDFAATMADHLERAGAYPEAAQQYESAAHYAQSLGAAREAEWLQARATILKSTPPDTRPLSDTGILRGTS
jgi:class 3 adenylate cyclase